MTSSNLFNSNEDSSILLEFTKNFSKPFDSDQLFNIESLQDNTSMQIQEQHSCFIPNSERSLNIEEFLSKETNELKINSAVRSSQKSFIHLTKLEPHQSIIEPIDHSVNLVMKNLDFNNITTNPNPNPNNYLNNINYSDYLNPQSFSPEKEEENYSYKSSLRNSNFPAPDPSSSSLPQKSQPKNPLTRLKTKFLKESPSLKPGRRELEDMSPFSEYSNRRGMRMHDGNEELKDERMVLEYGKYDEMMGKGGKERAFYVDWEEDGCKEGNKLRKYDKCDELVGRVEKERGLLLEREGTKRKDERGGRERNDLSGFIRKTNDGEKDEQQGRGSNGRDASSFVCIQKYLDQFGLNQRNKDPETFFNTRIEIKGGFVGDEKDLEEERLGKDWNRNQSALEREIIPKSLFSFKNEWSHEEEQESLKKHRETNNDGLAGSERKVLYEEKQFYDGRQVKLDFRADNEKFYGEGQKFKDAAVAKNADVLYEDRQIKEDFLSVNEKERVNQVRQEEKYSLEKFINDFVEVYTQDMESNWFTNERENIQTETENEAVEQKDVIRKKSKSNYELRERSKNVLQESKSIKIKVGPSQILPHSSSYIPPPSSSPPSSSQFPCHSSNLLSSSNSCSNLNPPSYLPQPKKNGDNKENLRKVECVQINICRKNGEFSDLFKKGGKIEGVSYKEIKNKSAKRN